MIGANPSRRPMDRAGPVENSEDEFPTGPWTAENASTRSTGILGGNEPKKDRKMTALNN
jgi:hypothetical protein